MKFSQLLFFASFYLLISCDSIKDLTKKNSKPEKDTPPLVKNINIIEELKKKGSGQECSEYKSSLSFFGYKSIHEPIRNCLAQKIDQGFKPLCEQEKALRRELQKEKDPVIQEEIQDQLVEVEEAKHHIYNNLYLIAANFDNLSEDFRGEKKSDHNDIWIISNTLINSINVKTEIGDFTQFVNFKSRQACWLSK